MAIQAPVLASPAPVLATVVAAVLALGACCPDPSSPAEAGGPSSGDGATAGGARFSAIQKDLLDQHCVTDCHETLGPNAGLSLSPARAYQSLVNVASQQITSQLRVAPGSADTSYLIKKLEGAPGIVGVQMPRLAPPRPQAEIDQVRAWIDQGALGD